IGTDKAAGAVEVYGMDGGRLQRITDGRANGVDIRSRFPYQGGHIDLVVVGGGNGRTPRWVGGGIMDVMAPQEGRA
ncbi:MAG: hypothetical protein ACRDYV_02500, partial [Acidimicrobiia bacterium]